MAYAPLRNYSSYSLLESSIPISALVQKGVQNGWESLGLMDRHHLFGALEFSIAAVKSGLFPVIGCVISLRPAFGESTRPYPLPILARTRQGYHNLCRLVSASTLDPQGPRETVSLEQLSSLSQGLIILSGNEDGPIKRFLRPSSKTSLWQQYWNHLQAIGKDNFFLEIQRYGEPYEPFLEDHLLPYAFEKGVPVIATQESYFLEPGHKESYEALLAIADGTYLGDPKRRQVSDQLFLKSSEEIKELFHDLPQGIHNTGLLVQTVDFCLQEEKVTIPRFLSPTRASHEDQDPEKEFFLKESQDGLRKRLKEKVLPRFPQEEWEGLEKTYSQRLAYETNLIITMGFSGYFLIVSDFIRWAKKNQIPVGPGRGSGASSLVAWSLEITEIDPIRYHLFFERFLNPERISMPDFDIDFCQERRDEVLEYVQKKYGRDRVAHIITFGTLQSRGVLRDVGRVLQMPYSQVDHLCKLVPHNPANPISLKEALTIEPQLQKEKSRDEQMEKLFEIGERLEGLHRHASLHAAGVVISDSPLVNCLPLYKDPRSSLPATEFSFKLVEKAGLVKFDFLGLKTLTILEAACRDLSLRGIRCELSSIPLDDAPTFDLLGRVETVGVFQLEGYGVSSVLKQLQPQRFEEIIALIALYRPGPMDSIPQYLACRHGREVVTYPYPCLEDILKETFGLMVYQEQVLQIARTLAGYTLGAADLLRKAMGKKIPEEMAKQEKIFIKGVLERHGGPEAKARDLFQKIAKFAGYAFNKAHSTSYALISYQTAYMKAHHPVEFMVATLNGDLHLTDKIAFFMEEVKRMGIPVLPPDVNHSCSLFKVEPLEDDRGLAIRYGLGALKNVGRGLMEALEEERRKNGLFTSLYDFFERFTHQGLNKRLVEGLIMSGAFDSLSPCRKQIWDHMSLLMAHGQAPNSHQLFAKSHMRPPLKATEEWPFLEKINKEYQAFGFYQGVHPLAPYWQFLQRLGSVTYHALRHHRPEGDLRERYEKQFMMAGVLLGLEEKTTRSRKKVSILKVSDLSGTFELMLFSDTREKFLPYLRKGEFYLLHLSARWDQEQMRLTGHSLEPLPPRVEKAARAIKLKVSSPEKVDQLLGLLDRLKPGKSTLEIWLCLPGFQGYCLHTKLPDLYAFTWEVLGQWHETFQEDFQW